MVDHRVRSREALLETAHTSIEAFALAAGFRAGAVACGLKESGAPDLTLIVADAPCTVAGVFTTNLIQAAPVVYDHDIVVRAPRGIRAVLANAGCANACTGEPGLADTRRSAARVAEALGCKTDQVLVLSTGVIGRRLDMPKLERGIAELAARLAAPAESSPSGGAEAARAIMTTDTRPKVAAADVAIDGRTVAVRGIAKGAGMIHPDMATMLALVTTDAHVEPALLDRALRAAVVRSFNRISVDGDMSTNDTVLLLASGVSGAVVGQRELPRFEEALGAVCVSLARQIAADGEGATRLVEITVSGAGDEDEAHIVADAIARSALVKTAIHGGDPNWGRILAAAGSSGMEIDPDRLTLVFGGGPGAVPGSDGGEPVTLVEHGLPTGADPARAAALLAQDPVSIRLDLGQGSASATVWTCDLSAEYVAINAHYTT